MIFNRVFSYRTDPGCRVPSVGNDVHAVDQRWPGGVQSGGRSKAGAEDGRLYEAVR